MPSPTTLTWADIFPATKMWSWGIERAQEEWLLAAAAEVVVRKDTDDETTTPPIPGNPVVLTIDILLRASRP